VRAAVETRGYGLPYDIPGEQSLRIYNITFHLINSDNNKEVHLKFGLPDPPPHSLKNFFFEVVSTM